MAKSNKLPRKSDCQHHKTSLHKLSSRCTKLCKDAKCKKGHPKEKREWEDAVCSVCMESPHNAVLLLCSSYDKGCRPYMCATSRRYSNCLDQYRKAYTKVTSTKPWQGIQDDLDFTVEPSSDGKKELPELMCPLCRGNVKGWTVVEPARRYLNAKKRTCMQDNCSFMGSYKGLKKHVRLAHPLSQPRKVDPSRAEKWKKLENEREISDVYSTIRSTTPGAIIVGDYVIEVNNDSDDDYFDDAPFRLGSFGGRWNGPRFAEDIFQDDYDSLEEEEEEEFYRSREQARAVSRRNSNRVSPSARPRARLFVARRRGRSRGGS